MTDAVVFTAHRFDAQVVQRFATLRAACTAGEADRGGYAVHISAEADVPVPVRYEHLTHRFDFSELGTIARELVGSQIVPGNAHLRSLDFRRHHPEYSNYWFVEYDVVYHGDWRCFFAHFDADRSDLLATRVRSIAGDPDWPWQWGFRTGDDAVDRNDWIHAFLPIHRISARGLDSVRQAVERGWVGHFEALVPTAVAFDSLSVADIGGRGPWTPPERRDRLYLDHTLPDRYQCIGTMRFRPSIGLMPVRDVLYHPCKPATDRSAVWPFRLRWETFKRAFSDYPRQTTGYVLRLVTRTVSSRRPRRNRSVPVHEVHRREVG